MVGAAVACWRAHPSDMGVKCGGWARACAVPFVCFTESERHVLVGFPWCSHRIGGLLGDPKPQYSGFYTLCKKPAFADVRTGSRTAADDDRVRIYRCCGNKR